MISELIFPARCSVVTRSIMTVDEPRKYLTLRPYFASKALLIAAATSFSSEPKTTTSPSFLAAWISSGDCPNTVSGENGIQTAKHRKRTERVNANIDTGTPKDSDTLGKIARFNIFARAKNARRAKFPNFNFSLRPLRALHEIFRCLFAALR